MLDPVEVLDLKHCRKTDPEWAAIKARHYREDAVACDARVAAEFVAFADTGLPEYFKRNMETAESFAAMAERYRARARILMGEEL